MANWHDPPESKEDKARSAVLLHASIAAVLATAFILIGHPDYWFRLLMWILAYTVALIIVSASAR